MLANGRFLICKQYCFQVIKQMFSTGYLNINNVDLYYEHAGNSQDAILCIPGALGTCRSDFSYQLDNLSKDFSIVSFDPRGYGKSRKNERLFPSNYYEIDAADGAAIMRELGFNKYSVLGWSDGGIVGSILASREQKSVHRLVVWGSNAFVAEEDVRLIELTRELDKWSERMRKPLEDTYGKDGLKKLWNNWMDAYLKFANNPNGNICIQDLKHIKCPTLIIHGVKDAIVASVHPEFLHKNIQNSKLVVWPEGKHNLHMKFNKEFNELVSKFVME